MSLKSARNNFADGTDNVDNLDFAVCILRGWADAGKENIELTLFHSKELKVIWETT